MGGDLQQSRTLFAPQMIPVTAPSAVIAYDNALQNLDVTRVIWGRGMAQLHGIGRLPGRGSDVLGNPLFFKGNSAC